MDFRKNVFSVPFSLVVTAIKIGMKKPELEKNTQDAFRCF